MTIRPVEAKSESSAVANLDAHDEALAQGYKDETCSKCGAPFLAHIHFVRCDARPCPMVSTKDTRTFLEQFADARPAGPRVLP